MNRRQMIRSLAAGSTMMPAIVSELMAAGTDPLAPRAPHFEGTAKRVIFLYMTGGVSHVDTFDPKPELSAAAEKGLTGGKKNATFLPTGWTWKKRGQSGIEMTDLLPEIAGCADKICLVRSMHGDHNDHFQATMGVHTGSVTQKRPSIGSWVSYGLGTENRNLPSFVVLAPQLPYAGSQVWSSDFLPGAHGGTRVTGGPEPVADLERRTPGKLQDLELGLLARLNQSHLRERGADPMLAARMKAFETAYGMQSEMPAVFDFSKESNATLALYGLERGQNTGFGWQCLVARRLAERGVRFIELIDTGSSGNWDVHGEIDAMKPLAKNVDRPIAGLLRDLESRGMLDDTLVVFTTEFGRGPWLSGKHGREHHCHAYSVWAAGGGFKRGFVYGKTTETGEKVAENPVHVHDFNATLLHCLGFDHTRLTYRHAGRDFRLTDIHGSVVKSLLA